MINAELIDTVEAQVEAEDAENTEANDAGSNTLQSEFTKEIRKLGREAGLGDDSLPKLGFAVLHYTGEGVLDSEKNKKCIHETYDMYMDQRSEKRVHSQGSDARSSQISKLKNWHELGNNKDIDGEAVMSDAQRLYKEKTKDGIKLQSVYAAYTAVARNSKELKTAPTEEQIVEWMHPKVKSPKTLSDIVRHLRDGLGDVLTGEGKHGVQCQDQEIIDAVGKLDEWLAKMTLAEELNVFREQAAALGVKLPKGF